MRTPPSAESQQIFRPGLFADQVALVTGGGSGIGLATALEFARLGARVAICGRTADKLARTLERIARHRDGVIDTDDLRRVVRDVEATLVDRAARSVRWSDLVRLVLERLRAIDPVSADRFEASYRDERGVVRLDDAEVDAPGAGRPQLGLFGNPE